MSYGKMNRQIDIVSTAPTKDAEGFTTHGERVLAHVRAYMEQKHGSEVWANRATFSEANVLFRFRSIPGLVVDTALLIAEGDRRYNIMSVEDVRGRGMYIEVLAKEVKSGG